MSQNTLSKPANVISWILQLVDAVILFQTLFFKFTAAPSSVFIFETIGLEPVGRYGSGIVELVAGILLLTSRFSWAGAVLALCVMIGAIGSHLSILGIEVMDDGGTLFSLALVVTIGSVGVLSLRRRAVLALMPFAKAQDRELSSVPNDADRRL
ncbi:MAG: DoxX family protein [Lentimonas sp.]